jgi:hypothetical protein
MDLWGHTQTTSKLYQSAFCNWDKIPEEVYSIKAKAYFGLWLQKVQSTVIGPRAEHKTSWQRKTAHLLESRKKKTEEGQEFQDSLQGHAPVTSLPVHRISFTLNDLISGGRIPCQARPTMTLLPATSPHLPITPN